jgi:hypothetical protein
MEDALKKLENLTQEETRMANSQLVREVRDTAATVGGSVSSIDNPEPMVPGVDDMEVGISEMNRS